MVSNRKFFIALLFLFTGAMWAQAGAYYIRQSEDGKNDDDKNSEIVQRFSWEANEDVLKYEFTIEEQNDNGEFVEKDFIETENNWVEQTLSAGEYRYKIAAYNFLGIKEQETSWHPVHIIKAYLPNVKDVSPTLLYLEEPQTGVFEINGTDLREGLEVYLGDNRGKPLIIGTVLEHDEKNRKLKVLFNPKELDSKKYSLYVKNIGGLTSRFYPVTIKYKKAVDFDIAGGYQVPVVLFDDTFPQYFDTKVFPVSGFAKITLVPFKHNYGFWGIGAQGSYTRMFVTKDLYSIGGNLITGHGNLVYQLPIWKKNKADGTKKRLACIELHGGAGVAYLWDYTFHFQHNLDSDPLNSLNLSADAGASVQIYLSNRLYLETNVDFVMAFMSDMTLGMVTPGICVGWQF